jgi:Transposase DDE domain
MTLLLQRMGWAELNELDQRKHGAGRPAHILSRGQLLAALLFHYTVTWTGSFAEHLFWLLGVKMAESTLSERRQALPFEVFQQLLKRLLRPIVACGGSAQAFYRQWRLVAVDGVCFSLPNTPQVKKHCRKGGNQHGKAAFAKLHCAALVELVMHNPLAACLGRHGESEWELAQGLLDHLPQKCLLLADRLYGCGAFLVAAMERLQRCDGHFLVRVKKSLKVVRQIKRLKDGSQLVEIKALIPGDTHRVAATLQVREIQATLQRQGFRPVRVRLWTSLTDPKQAPAEELVRLYMTRWEHELYFRELKHELGVNDLLRSQTVETAAQEVAAMIIGSSLIAHERAKLKPGEELQHRISFIKTWETLEPLWLTLLLGADILSEEQKQQLCERFYWLASRRMMAKKRSRSCPRAMRQPIQPWPRKKNQKSSFAPLKIAILKASHE